MANNSKYDTQLERMQFLMGYGKPVNEAKKSSKIEYHTVGADGKVYGILKEGSMYYIMTTEKGKETLAESYEYIGGHNYRNENGYKSYNEATKHLELKMISLNEANHKHVNVSTVDVDKNKKNMAVLTEAARKELDRMHQIFENSKVIGKNNTGDPESKGKATDPTKQGEPFEQTAKAELDKDLKATATVESATDDTKVGDVEKDLESDSMKTKKVDTAEQPKDAHDDLEGEGVADKHPSGGKVVKMNEGVLEGDAALVGDDAPVDDFDEDSELDSLIDGLNVEDEPSLDMEEPVDGEEPVVPKEPIDEPVSDVAIDSPESDEVDFDAMLREFEETEKAMHGEKKNIKSKIKGPDEVMDGPHGGLDAQVWDKLQESIEKITEKVTEQLCGAKKEPKKVEKKKETIQEAIDRIVAEEVTHLNAWGKHPRYQKPAFQTPDNKEVSVNGSEDWNDESTKGSEAYGKKVGKSDPFDKVVNMVLDSVKSKLQEAQKSKKA